MTLTPDTARWFLDRRGISEDTLTAWGIESFEQGVKIPYPSGAQKIRATLEKDDNGRHRMWWDPPATTGQLPFLPPNWAAEGKTRIVFEGETDTLAAWQNAPADVKPHILGMSGANAFGPKGIPDAMLDKLFGESQRVFFVFDNEDPYEGNEAYESIQRAKRQIREKLGRKAKFVTLPQGPQDTCEFFGIYDWAAFAELLKDAVKPVTHYPRLDLTKDVPETNWLVDDLFVRQEATVFASEAGAGKSWFIMALALAVAGNEDTFLGKELKAHGKVIVVDEEQSQEIVYQRLHALGFDKDVHLPNLEYLWYPGVDLMREPHKLLEEAIDRDPVLIVLESMSRVSLGVDENSNTEMSQLWRGGIIPLARETDACVIATHHVPSDDKGKPRGATAIKAAADESLTLMKGIRKDGTETGTLFLYPSKPRRELTRMAFSIEGHMKDGEPVRLVPEDAKEVPF